MELEEILYIIGQCLGVVAIALGFISFQLKTQGQLLIAQTATATVFCLHYALIGGYTAMAMNMVGIVRCIAFYFRNKKGSKSIFLPILFAVIMAAAGILTWEAWYSVFVFLGLVINSVCLSFSNPQNVRKSILVTSPMVIVYNCFKHSYGGIVYETIAIISSAIGIARNTKKQVGHAPDGDN